MLDKHRGYRIFVPLAFILPATCPTAVSRDTPPFSVEVDLVQVLASVRDPNGQIVSDLTKADFILEEGGKIREIKHGP